MKSGLFLFLVGFLFIGKLSAQVTTSDQFFTAYQVAQVDGTSKLIAQYAKSPKIVDAIAKDYLSKHYDAEILKKYEQDSVFRQAIQQVINDYLNSEEAIQLYDSLATKMLINNYDYEELKALYQLYDNPAIQDVVKSKIAFKLTQSLKYYQSNQVFQAELESGTQQLLDNNVSAPKDLKTFQQDNLSKSSSKSE